MDWTIRKYAVHLQMDGPFVNGLKWQLDCIKSLLQNKGVHRCYLSPLPTTPSPIAVAHRRCLPPSSITVTYRCHPSPLPITVAYYYHLSLSPITVAYQYMLWPTGNSDGQ